MRAMTSRTREADTSIDVFLSIRMSIQARDTAVITTDYETRRNLEHQSLPRQLGSR